MTHSARTLRTAPLVVLAIALSACGGDDPTPVDGAAESVDCSTTEGATITVEIPDFRFEPGSVDVSACDEIVWSNTHDQAHTSTGNGDQAWSTGNVQPGSESAPVPFETTGTFTYICALHPFMKGTVQVS